MLYKYNGCVWTGFCHSHYQCQLRERIQLHTPCSKDGGMVHRGGEDLSSGTITRTSKKTMIHSSTFSSISHNYEHLSSFLYICRIKTGHSNLVSCFGLRMRALAKVFYQGKSRGKIPCQRSNSRAKTWHKIWMTGLNPNCDTTPIPSLQNSQNNGQKSSFTYDHLRHLILPLPPVHALPTVNAPTCCQGAPIDDVTISYFRSLGQFESLVNASCQRIILWIIRTPIMHID